jgi:hypothetical protein
MNTPHRTAEDHDVVPCPETARSTATWAGRNQMLPNG